MWPHELHYPTITLPRFPTTASLFNQWAEHKKRMQEEARAKAEDGIGAGGAVISGGSGMRAGKLRRKRVPKAPVLKDERVVQKMYRMRPGMGRNGPWEHRVWRGDLKGANKWYCVHNRPKNNCRACGGVSICHHDRRRSQCKVRTLLDPVGGL